MHAIAHRHQHLALDHSTAIKFGLQRLLAPLRIVGRLCIVARNRQRRALRLRMASVAVGAARLKQASTVFFMDGPDQITKKL